MIDKYDKDTAVKVKYGMREQMKKCGYAISRGGHPGGLLIVACSHFFRSLEHAEELEREHPKFPEYLKHWLASIRSGDGYFDKNQLDELITEFGVPEKPRMQGGSYWYF